LVGHVYDADNNEPLIGVTIKIKGEKGGAISDLNGEYQINVNSRSELVFSYVGYKTKSVLVGDLGILDVKMESDNQILNGVVVVGAGTQKRISVTGAITSIGGGELRAPSASLTNNLAGQLAGVISMTSSGEPGSASDFYIRGVGTFGGRATPLILLDDVEISANDLNNIPAESIKTVSVLKDASATAIYGARGANGVMLIRVR
jgi:TonB-dependent SusC/RagA subfamily outer membrane receptor